MVKKELKEKWRENDKREILPSYDKSLKKELKSYIEYCTQFAWRMVTQLPPLKVDYNSSTYNPDYHNESQAFASSARRETPVRWANAQDRTLVKCYVWPTLYDYDNRVIEKGDVILTEYGPSSVVSSVWNAMISTVSEKQIWFELCFTREKICFPALV